MSFFGQPYFFRRNLQVNITKLITGPFSINTWIVPFYQNKVLIIDPAACDLTHDQNKITYYLEQNNLEPTAILLTHGHFDHIPGTKILKEKPRDPQPPLRLSPAERLHRPRGHRQPFRHRQLVLRPGAAGHAAPRPRHGPAVSLATVPQGANRW